MVGVDNNSNLCRKVSSIAIKKKGVLCFKSAGN